jgi:hypothetical protein
MDGGNEQRVDIIFFSNQSLCDRNTSIGAKGLWELVSEPIKSF